MNLILFFFLFVILMSVIIVFVVADVSDFEFSFVFVQLDTCCGRHVDNDVRDTLHPPAPPVASLRESADLRYHFGPF